MQKGLDNLNSIRVNSLKLCYFCLLLVYAIIFTFLLPFCTFMLIGKCFYAYFHTLFVQFFKLRVFVFAIFQQQIIATLTVLQRKNIGPSEWSVENGVTAPGCRPAIKIWAAKWTLK